MPTLPRLLSPEEHFNLPSRKWENALVDTRTYYPIVMTVIEVDAATYQQAKNEGTHVMQHEGRYYIGH